MKARISVTALRDLAAIVAHIAEQDAEAATRFGDGLIAKALAIADRPLSFPVADIETRPDLRKRSYRKYIVLFRIARNTVVIVRIVHGARDYQRLFGRR